MTYLKRITAVLLLTASCSLCAQVGINTTDPQNDLHINGGVRIEDVPKGTDEDAVDRLLALTPDGDIVQVLASSVLKSLRVPVLAFNAHFGVTPSPNDVPFFDGCNPCARGQIMPLNFNDDEIIIASPFVTLNRANNTTLGDEYFVFTEEGDYRVELNMAPIYGGDSRYRINIILTVFNETGTVVKAEEAIRLYAGQPTVASSTYGIPGYVTDTRNYAAGDILVMDIEVATASGDGDRSVESGRVIGASYGSQITITKY